MEKSRLFTAVALLGALSLAGCTTVSKVYYTVGFDTNGAEEIASVEVEKGHKIAVEIADPVIDSVHLFSGWYEDDETFLVPFAIPDDVVTHDMTLFAKWRILQSYPTEIAINTALPFSSSLTWSQGSVDSHYDYTVTLYPLAGEAYSETGTVVPGTYTVDGSDIVWTPSAIPQGGTYEAVIDTLYDDTVLSTVSQEGLVFKGAGTEANPYLLIDPVDVYDITKAKASVGCGLHYVLNNDIAVDTVYLDSVGTVFEGELDGNGHTITMTTGNFALFDRLSATAYVHDLILAGTLNTGAIALIAALASSNAGLIEDVDNSADVTSTAGTVGDLSTKDAGGAAGIVGRNETTGIIRRCDNNATIKARIGGGGIVSQNLGTLESCRNLGTLGAGNAVESSKSLSAYSYMGGIAGFNSGVITQSRTTSTGKLLAQRYTTSTPTDTSNNRVIGGIAGYNMAGGTITLSYFSGIRCMGDQYVGGISGINAGTISNCYSAGLYYDTPLCRSYVGARLHVGGIAGLLEGAGSIDHCYNTANVYSFTAGDQPYGIASAATHTVTITQNLDPRSSGTQTYGNTITDTLVAPTGDNNATVISASMAGTIDDYILGDYTALLGSAFVYDPTLGTILAFQVV